MNVIDIFVIAIIVIFAFIGFRKGFVSQLFQAAGIFFAFWLNTPVSEFIAYRFSDGPEGTVLLLSGIVSFLLIYFVFLIAGWLLSKVINFTLTSLPNRAAGIVFGSVKGFFIVTVMFLVIRAFSEENETFLSKYIIPDKKTDMMIDRALDIAEKAADPETGEMISRMKDTSSDEFEEDSASYSRIGYAAYRISKMMDPFVANIRNMAEKKIDGAIEEKVQEKIEKIKDRIEQ